MPTFPTLTLFFFFFFNDTATTEIYTLSLHDALPICSVLAVYENAFSNGQRYGIGGGVTHMGKRLGQARTQAEADRKSTRLNSSHQIISYAVFCLKKKNCDHKHTRTHPTADIITTHCVVTSA